MSQPAMSDRRVRPAPDAAPAVDRRGSAYARVQEDAGVGIWSSETATGQFRTNAAARAILEWPADRPPPVGADLMAAVHPDDRDRVAEHMARARATGQGYTLDHRLLLPSGEVRHMHAAVRADVNDQGEVTAVHGVTLDVTDLRAAREEAEAQRNLSRWILSNLTEGYVLVREREITEVNDAFCRITGYRREELLGSHAPHPFWHVQQVDELLALRETTRTVGHGAGEFTFVHRNGEHVRVALTATATKGSDGAGLWLVLVRDITEERAQERRLRATAATDPLTGVPNSGAFRQALREQVAAHAQSGTPLTLALVDVDHFKQVNDVHGHAAGDEVLIGVATRLRAATRHAGALYRVGGEEFAVLLPGLDSARATALVEQALDELRRSSLPPAGVVTASAGVAELTAGVTPDALFQLADQRLYKAKANGRDQVCS